MKNGWTKKNGYCALTLNGHIIQVRNKVTETIMDSFLEEKGCNEKMFQKSVMLSPILIAKKKKKKS